MEDELTPNIKKIYFSITYRLFEKMKEHNMFLDFDNLMSSLILKELERREHERR